jgi:two-component system, NarL family, nitrate/nitrite response regulator NarL
MEQRERIRIVIADDHQLLRAGLKSLLDAEPGFTVVGEADDGEEAVRLARALEPDVLLLDLAMPGVSGMDALAELARTSTPVRTIVLTAAIEKPEIVKALQLGARGVVLKASAAELLFKSIHSVMAGQHWIGRAQVDDLVHALRASAGDTPARPLASAPAERASPRRFGLTARELEITGAVVAGFRNREIAEKLSLSEDTVKHHLSNIFDKVGASNRLELALFAVHHRLLADRVPTSN